MTIDELFFYLALAAYLVGALHYLLYILKPNQHIGTVATVVTLAGFAAHSLSHVLCIYALKRPPLSSPYESLSFFAWAIVLIYLVIELRYRNRIMGAFVLPLALLAGSGAAALPRRIAELRVMKNVSKAASEQALQELHKQVAEALTKAVEPVPILNDEKKVVGYESNAAALNAAIRFLKDNGIEVARGTNESIRKPADRLPTTFDEEDDSHAHQ